MSDQICPNINTCRLITTDVVVTDPYKKEAYMVSWCRDTGEKWKDCKRYSTKASLGFCPDFVLPETTLTIDEIIEKFDEQS